MAKLPLNFRPVIEGHVYRSANVDSADSQELQRWTNELGITTILDLRSMKDISMTSASKNFVRRFYPLSFPDEFLAAATPTPTRVALNIESQRFYKAVFKTGSVWNRIVAFFLILWYMISGNRDPLMRYGAKNLLGSRGLNGMFTILLDCSPESLKQVFQIILKASKGGIVIACMNGKDRTGLISALLQDLMNHPREKIRADFHRSEDEIQSIQKALTDWFVDHGFPESFAYADAREIDLTIEHIHKTYGSTEGYLEYTGLSKSEIEQLKSNLSH